MCSIHDPHIPFALPTHNKTIMSEHEPTETTRTSKLLNQPMTKNTPLIPIN